MIMERSTRREVRNPVLGLPAARRIQALSPEAREALQAILRDIAIDANNRAQTSWRQSKGPMAAYWKAVSVYAKHIRAAVNAGRRALKEVA
jgi:hypothetical protein